MAKLTANQEQELRDAFNLFDTGTMNIECTLSYSNLRSFGENIENGIKKSSSGFEYQSERS
jgi:Ca2+-binding EF-hand superfamily protein